MKAFISLCLLAVFLISSCGVYTFNPRGKSDISRINVERFENETSEFGIEDRMTNQIIDAFIADGTLKIVPTEDAQAILTGSLIEYDRKPYNADENDVVESYSVRMTFNVKLTNSADGVDMWTERISQQGIYRLADETEEDGQQRAIELLIENIINKTTKSW